MLGVRSLSLASLSSLVACGFSINTGSSIDADTTTDGTNTVDADPDAPPIDAAIDGMVSTWSTPVQVQGIPSGATNVTLTADMKQAWFVLVADIYRVTRPNTTSSFGSQSLAAELSNGAAEATPEVAPDGLSITFARFVGNYDLYSATWNAGTSDWNAPAAMVDLNAGSQDQAATISDDQLMLAMASTRVATTSDIFISTRTMPTGAWGEPVVQVELNSTEQDSNAFLSGDKLTICFDSNRSGNYDIYCATRSSPTATWSQPAPLSVGSPQNDQDPWLTPDGKTLVFWSDRSGSGRVYVSTRP